MKRALAVFVIVFGYLGWELIRMGGFDGWIAAALRAGLAAHLGSTITRPYVERVVAQVNALSPDVIAITGDLVDGTPSQLGQDFAPLADLRARSAKFYITGNHEYYWGADAWIEAMRNLGITPLI